MKHLFSALALLAVVALPAQTVVKLSLAQAQEYAVKNAYSVQNQNLEV
jgi:hypothetical protein